MAANTPISRPGAARSRPLVSFWLHAGVLALLMFAASAPSPLYPFCAAQWRLTSATVTEVFALYALALLAALLVAGRLSDHAGRRPVIVAALAVEAAAMAWRASSGRTLRHCSTWPGSCRAWPPVRLSGR